jgi:HSP20 family protein
VIRPLADVHETEEALGVTMDMPGVEKQDINISVVEDELQISAQRKSEAEVNEQDYHRRERTFTRFERRVLLPESIKTEEARATLTNGVLQITLPKVSVLTRKRIAID